MIFMKAFSVAHTKSDWKQSNNDTGVSETVVRLALGLEYTEDFRVQQREHKAGSFYGASQPYAIEKQEVLAAADHRWCHH